MHILGLFLILLLSLVAESTLLVNLQIFGVTPDLVLVWVIILTLLWGPKRGTALGFVFGLVEDLFFAKYVGTNALAKMAVGLFIGGMEGKLYKDNILVPVIATFSGSVVYQFCIWILEIYLGRMVEFNFILLLGFSLYNSFIAFIFYRRFYKSHTGRWLKTPEQWRELGG